MGRPDQPRGADGRWVRRSGAAVIAGTVLASVGAYGPIGVSGGGVSAVVDSSIGQVTRGVLTKAKRSAARGNRQTAWRQLGLQRLGKPRIRTGRCAVDSYGQVQQFFVRKPCRALRRMLVPLGDGSGNEIVVSVSWVEMPDRQKARELRDLVDIHGTGNVAPLPGSLVGAGEIDWTGLNYDSRPSGRTVVIAEVEPLRGSPHPEYMDGVADIAANLPRP